MFSRKLTLSQFPILSFLPIVFFFGTFFELYWTTLCCRVTRHVVIYCVVFNESKSQSIRVANSGLNIIILINNKFFNCLCIFKHLEIYTSSVSFWFFSNSFFNSWLNRSLSNIYIPGTIFCYFHIIIIGPDHSFNFNEWNDTYSLSFYLQIRDIIFQIN